MSGACDVQMLRGRDGTWSCVIQGRSCGVGDQWSNGGASKNEMGRPKWSSWIGDQPPRGVQQEPRATTLLQPLRVYDQERLQIVHRRAHGHDRAMFILAARQPRRRR